MSATQHLHTSLLRAPVIHILRAAGFHSTRPSVLDTLVNITERYLLLLASSTAAHAITNHNSPIPNITDVRLALTDAGILVPVHGGAEEDWREKLRRPLEEFDDLPQGATRKEREIRRREEEDTRDVREFVRWVMGDQNKEIRRIAGMLPETEPTATNPTEEIVIEDYLSVLKKKHSKTGEESRYQGTVLGKPAEDRPVKIEGGPVETLQDWCERLREQAVVAPDSGRSSPSTLKSEGAMRDDEMPNAEMQTAE